MQGKQAVQPNPGLRGSSMCGMLDHYRHLFTRLRVDTDPRTWTTATTFRAPYKPLLLLATTDLIAHAAITRNFIEPSDDLSGTWLAYLNLMPPMNRRVSMAASFFSMGNERFWHLTSRSGLEERPRQPIRSLKKLRERYYGAKVNDDLFPLLQMRSSREKLRTIIIETYFDSDLWSLLREHCARRVEELG